MRTPERCRFQKHPTTGSRFAPSSHKRERHESRAVTESGVAGVGLISPVGVGETLNQFRNSRFPLRGQSASAASSFSSMQPWTFQHLLPRILHTTGADRYVCRSGSSVGREFASLMTVSRLSARWRSAKSRSPEFW